MKLDHKTIKDRLKTSLGLDAKTSKIVVVGLGITGASVARYLVALGFDFIVADSREQPTGIAELRKELGDIKVLTGAFDVSMFKMSTHLVVSPGIPLTEKAITEAVHNGACILGDIDLFACSTDAPIIAITGANGKSTVTTLLGEMAQAAGKQVGVGGNLGTPALALLKQPAELYVLELSSFQLERTSQLNAAAATVLNVTADHLDRHVNLVDYAKQKQRVFNGNGVMIINADDPLVVAMQEPNRNALTFSILTKADFWIAKDNNVEWLIHGEKPLLPLSEVPLEGRHNVANVLAALALGTAVGLNTQSMCKAIKTFKGLAHRMQRVAEIRGATWVNDSKATNIGACIAALQGYQQKVVLIVGGDSKGADMSELVPVVREKAKCVVLMGKDAGLIGEALNDCVPTYKADDMQQAVNIAASLVKAGECVLLSPACASLDQYKDYQDRGNQFIEAVLRLANTENPKLFTASMVGL